MDTNFSRHEVINDDKLKALALKKEQLVLSGRAKAQELEDLAKRHKEIADEVSKMMDEVNEIKRSILKGIGKHLKKMELAEYESFLTTEVKDGDLVVTIVDEFAEWNDAYKKKDKFAFLPK